MQNSFLVVGGMFVFIVAFFFFELFILLGLRFVAKRAEDAEVTEEESKTFGGRKRGRLGRPGATV